MNQTERDELTIIQKMRGRRVTHEEAAVSAQRLVNSHFHNPDSARVSIPANPADDDLIITDYVKEQAAESQRMRELLTRAKSVLYGGHGLGARAATANEIESFLAEHL